ncbi:hypothetical protein FM114_02460 [Luteococcus japonicus LSP_Lj1]|uniref:Uncharacterized protein n=1 Tax=Luteococcus japonicus LSP_Lj1 TaxID=1255658 RepID=A0A1R4ILF5_9ACTN|nr:hypothetical protein FM114_02460 [Luteococcus japonicus LSP_Lj1]
MTMAGTAEAVEEGRHATPSVCDTVVYPMHKCTQPVVGFKRTIPPERSP